MGSARLRSVVVIAALLVGALAAPARPAAAADVRAELLDAFPVAPGLTQAIYRARMGSAGADVNVLTFDLDDPRLRFTTELANGTIPGREPLPDTTARLGAGAIAGVNGTFFDPDAEPYGDPFGLLMADGAYVSEPQTQYHWGWRGAFGITGAGDYLVGRPGFLGDVYVVAEDGSEVKVPVDGIGRRPKAPTSERPTTSQLTLMPPASGDSTGTPAGTVEVVLRPLTLTPAGSWTLPVHEVRTAGNTIIPRDGIVVAATGAKGETLAAMAPGAPVRVVLEITPGWESIEQAVAVGPLLLQDGRATGRDAWETEGFNPVTHSDRRHPRTAIGFREDGTTLLVTVDGRSSRNAGMSINEVVDLLLDLDVHDAVMLDGGGSTTMVADHRVVNVPSDGRARANTSALVVHTDMRVERVRRLDGADRFATAARVAAAGWPDGAERALLASGRDFPDGLAAGPLSAALDAPLLFTEPAGLPSATLAGLRTLGVDEVTIIGGHKAVSEDVVEQLRAAGFEVARIWGNTRVATAAAVAGVHGARDGRAFVVSADAFPDALSAAVPASLAGAPLLLTHPDGLHPDVAQMLDVLGVREVVIGGGEAAVSDQVVAQLRALGVTVQRVAGADRFETSTQLARWAVDHASADIARLILADGTRFPDALAGGPLGARERTPVVLVHPRDPARSPATERWLARYRFDAGTVLGGKGAISSYVAWHLDRAIRTD